MSIKDKCNIEPNIKIVEAALLKNKTITENGTYNPVLESIDGYSKVTVAVGDPVDLSNDTVTPKTVLEGYTFHDASKTARIGEIPTYDGSIDSLKHIGNINIIEVDELPETGEKDVIYKVNYTKPSSLSNYVSLSEENVQIGANLTDVDELEQILIDNSVSAESFYRKELFDIDTLYKYNNYFLVTVNNRDNLPKTYRDIYTADIYNSLESYIYFYVRNDKEIYIVSTPLWAYITDFDEEIDWSPYKRDGLIREFSDANEIKEQYLQDVLTLDKEILEKCIYIYCEKRPYYAKYDFHAVDVHVENAYTYRDYFRWFNNRYAPESITFVESISDITSSMLYPICVLNTLELYASTSSDAAYPVRLHDIRSGKTIDRPYTEKELDQIFDIYIDNWRVFKHINEGEDFSIIKNYFKNDAVYDVRDLSTLEIKQYNNEIVDVNELPNNVYNIQENKVYRYNGELYKYFPDEVVSEIDYNSGTWLFNDIIDFSDISSDTDEFYASVSFLTGFTFFWSYSSFLDPASISNNYTDMNIKNGRITYISPAFQWMTAYIEESGWSRDAQKIYIQTNIEHEGYNSFRAFLEKNAHQVGVWHKYVLE